MSHLPKTVEQTGHISTGMVLYLYESLIEGNIFGIVFEYLYILFWCVDHQAGTTLTDTPRD